MKIYSKQQAAELITRLNPMTEKVNTLWIKGLCNLTDARFVKEFRRVTDLNLHLFAPGKFIIKYELA